MRTNIYTRLAILLLTGFVSVPAVHAQVNVFTQHNDLKRTGWMNRETKLTQTNVNSATFGKIFTRAVDDQLYAQPLVVSNLSVNNKVHNVVFAATVNNTVYAFDAESDTANTPLWQVSLTPPGYRAIKNTDMTGACFFNYKDFSGNMGIVGTPVIDSASRTLYVVARSVTNAAPKTFVQYLHAIDIRTGAEKQGSPVYITATVNGTGGGTKNGKITFDQQKQNQRPGLLLYKGVVYIAWASHCDWGPYHGWMMGYDAATLQQKYVYNATPDGAAAGIWMSGQAPAVDDKGFIYISTGNGTVGKNNNPNDTANRGESILKLSTASGKLRLIDFFTPADYQKLERGDLDYGVDGVLLLPNTNLSLSGSKESLLYLVNNNKMGKTSAADTGAIQQININAEAGGDHHLHGSPVYFKNYNNKEYIYAWAEGGLLKQIPFIRNAGIFDTANTITAQSALPPGMPGAMMAISSNAVKQGTGILWASHPAKGDANHAVVPGTLQAFDAGNVTHELWNSNQNKNRDSVGKFAKFVCPTIANGKVYLATFSGQLVVYGLINTATAQTDAAYIAAASAQQPAVAFEVYPNPSRGEVSVIYRNGKTAWQQVTIAILNTAGQVVYQQNSVVTALQNMITIHLPAAVSNGVYLLQLTDVSGAISSQKLVIER